MAGGLIQIASYGIHDIFLIGNPQITFFKTVYRRHTNFSMEYIEEPFNGTQNFGNYLSCNLSKAGDLVHRLYLKIAIPQVMLDKQTYSYDSNTTNQYIEFKKSYDQIQNFINSINFDLIQSLYKLTNIENLRYSEINSKYNISLNRMNYANKLYLIKNIKIMFDQTFNVPLNNNISNIIQINQLTQIAQFLDFDTYYKIYIGQFSQTLILDLKFLLDNYLLQLQIIKKQMYQILLNYERIHNILDRSNLNFAWVEYLGHQIINRVEIEIGGKVIDYTDAVRSNINYQLTNKKFLDSAYNKLIANIPEMTTFDSKTKPPYIMYIPLDFWFSKYSGLSIPLIYLRFHDVKINLKLNDLVNCCYYERLNSEYMIEELISLDSVSLIANYIYLDTDERKKFAQLTHEYLIDQTQYVNFTDIITERLNIELPFFNPVKQLFWVVRDKNNIDRLKYFEYSTSYYVDIYEFQTNPDNQNINKNLPTDRNLIKVRTVDNLLSSYIKVGDEIQIVNSIYYSNTYIVKKVDFEYLYLECAYFMREDYKYNYNIYVSNNQISYNKSASYSGNSQAFVYKVINSSPVTNSLIELNGITRLKKIDSIYTNYVQPYQHNSRAPDVGINTYSFCLMPEEYQPSGFCNFNKLDLKTMLFDFDPKFINKELSQQTNKSLELIIYAHNYNILRFAYGKAGIVLNI